MNAFEQYVEKMKKDQETFRARYTEQQWSKFHQETTDIMIININNPECYVEDQIAAMQSLNAGGNRSDEFRQALEIAAQSEFEPKATVASKILAKF